MFIVWRGWGILVIPIAFACFIVGTMIGTGLQGTGLMPNWAQAAGTLIGTAVSAGGIWIIAQMITNSRPPRRFIDQQTGQEIVVRSDAGSLFFIPTRFWAFIVLALGLLMSVSLALGHDPLAETSPSDATPAQKL
jgi:hypothetical protein